MNLDVDALVHNTADRRECPRVLNIPEAMDTLTLASYAKRRPIPQGVLDWLADESPERKSLVLCGEPGRGKTGLGIGVLREMARRNIGRTFRWNMATSPTLQAKIDAGTFKQTHLAPCWFERWPRLLALQKRTKWDEESWFENLEEDTALLMLDDIGVDVGTPFRESFLLRHLEWAEDKRGRALILTFNTEPMAWKTSFGERTFDRLTESRRFAIVKVTGERLRD